MLADLSDERASMNTGAKGLTFTLLSLHFLYERSLLPGQFFYCLFRRFRCIIASHLER